MGPLPTSRDIWEGIWGLSPINFGGALGTPPTQFWGLWVHLPPQKAFWGGCRDSQPLWSHLGASGQFPPPRSHLGGPWGPPPTPGQFWVSPHLHPQGVGDDPVHQILGEGVEGFVPASHELGFEQEPAASVVLEQPQVQLHRYVWGVPWGRGVGQASAPWGRAAMGLGGGVGTGNSRRFGRIGTSGARHGAEMWGRGQRRGAGSQWGAGCSCGGQRHSVPWGYGAVLRVGATCWVTPWVWRTVGCTTDHAMGHAMGLDHAMELCYKLWGGQWVALRAALWGRGGRAPCYGSGPCRGSDRGSGS